MINEKQVIDNYNYSINQHVIELEEEEEYKEARYFENKFYELESVTEDGDNIVLTTNKRIKDEDDAESILCYAFGFSYNWKFSYKGKTITFDKSELNNIVD